MVNEKVKYKKIVSSIQTEKTVLAALETTLPLQKNFYAKTIHQNKIDHRIID